MILAFYDPGNKFSFIFSKPTIHFTNLYICVHIKMVSRLALRLTGMLLFTNVCCTKSKRKKSTTTEQNLFVDEWNGNAKKNMKTTHIRTSTTIHQHPFSIYLNKYFLLFLFSLIFKLKITILCLLCLVLVSFSLGAITSKNWWYFWVLGWC